ncbi:GerAB/ArcD/ProY family transporter [Effusibacillus dendaii]|uniref:Putative spore germination protein YfkT n=1 Tax=Effusibacillus dendaii TaxID=2743772 RepID=A0A7I8D797_9BACL|nr:endospore germination permease [Effusibacillus dendaii]BCJ85867.1 putative spore germination protein YfkT [Effusibacillus dendaii]
MEQISERQLMMVGVSYVLVVTSLSLPAQIIGVARQDAWLAYFPAMIVAIVSLWLLSIVLKRFPKQDLFEAMIGRFRVWGRVVAFLYVLFFFFVLLRDIRIFVDFINTVLLPQTPVIIISVLIFFTVAIIARGGIEIVARMTELFLPILIAVILIIPIVTVKDFEYHYLLPLFENGLLPTLKGSWLAVSYLGKIMVLPLIFSNPTFRFRQGFYGLVLGVLLLEILIVLDILALGNNLSAHSVYPNYEMVRQIRLTDFLDRFDILIIGIYMPAMLTKISVSLYVVCHGLKRILPDVSVKLLTTPIAAFAMVCSFWFFKNTIQLMDFNISWTALALVFELFIPILLFFVLKPKKNKQPSLRKKANAA